MSQAAHDLAMEGLKAAPPVAVTGSILAGMTPTAIITSLTIAYLALQIGWLLWKYIDKWRGKPGSGD